MKQFVEKNEIAVCTLFSTLDLFHCMRFVIGLLKLHHTSNVIIFAEENTFKNKRGTFFIPTPIKIFIVGDLDFSINFKTCETESYPITAVAFNRK